MKFKSVSAARKGGPEVLQVIENDLRLPSAGEYRVKILATCVCLPDVQARYGQSPFAPKFPFVPGYAITGVVDEVGEPKQAAGGGVIKAAIGDRVAALTVYGGYAEYIYLKEGQLIPLPGALDPAEAVTLILNYLVAYQTMHRSAQVKAGDKVLIIGASGGIGTAYLQLGKLAELRMYGIAVREQTRDPHRIRSNADRLPHPGFRRGPPPGRTGRPGCRIRWGGRGLPQAWIFSAERRRHIRGVRQSPEFFTAAEPPGAGLVAQPAAEREIRQALWDERLSL